MLHQVDHIAALATAAAVPNPFCGVNAEAVRAAADRAGPLALGSSFKIKAPSRELIFDWHMPRSVGPRFEWGHVLAPVGGPKCTRSRSCSSSNQAIAWSVLTALCRRETPIVSRALVTNRDRATAVRRAWINNSRSPAG